MLSTQHTRAHSTSK